MKKAMGFITDPWHILAFYLIVNLLVMLLYGIDKAKAKSKKWRISEKALLIAAAFGIFGAVAGMRIFHHKTQKASFFVPVVIIFLLEAALAGLVIYKRVL